MLDTDCVSLSRLSTLLAELEDLKRQQPAHYHQSIASTLFVESWRRLLAGEEPDIVATKITTQAIIHILLPGCDGHFIREAGLSKSEAAEVYEKALQESTHERIDPALYEKLLSSVPAIMDEYFSQPSDRAQAFDQEAFNTQAWFVDVLCRQPRAGATKPGKPRLLLLPAEMHADHCLMTAVFAVLLAPSFGASEAQPFLTGLSHHLHNAVLPDCGFGGEMLLEKWLTGILQNARNKALANLNSNLAHTIREALAVHERLDIPEGRAVSAADVLDRVLDVKWRTRAAHVQDEDILSELELVHAGPLKEFQTDLLAQAGLWDAMKK